MRTLGEGMAGMTHENDIRIAEGLQNMELPADPAAAMAAWRSTLNDAVVDWHRARGCDMPDLNDLARRGIVDAINFAFPHYFLLPTYSSASSYRIRPLGPEETLFEIWSLTRFPSGPIHRQAHTTRTHGARRSALAADPRPRFLQPAATAKRPALQGV